MRRLGSTLLLAALFAVPGLAQPVVVSLSDLPCFPERGNAPLYVATSPTSPDHVVRAFFRRQAHGDLYYMLMHPIGNGSYWAVLPKPEQQNEMVEYHIHVTGPDGQTLATSPIRLVAVTADCKAELTDEQEDESENLRVGETHSDQKGRPVAWFMCDGIVERIGVEGEIRPDDYCGVPPPPAPLVLGSEVGRSQQDPSPSRPEGP
jgi:hypothetical protein